MSVRLGMLLCLLLIGASARSAEPITWDAVQAEPAPEKRARMALDLALSSIDGVVVAYHEGLPDEAQAMATRIVEAAQLALTSLEEPDAKPRHFKKAEIAARRLVRNLKSAQRELNYAEREELEPIIVQIEEINNQLLNGAMQRR